MSRVGFGNSNVDAIDMLAFLAVPLFGGVLFGVWTLGLSLFGGYSFSDAIFHIGDTAISVALVGTVAGGVALVANGTLTRGDYEQEEWYIIVIALLLPVAYVFVPAVESFIHGYDIAAFGAWTLLSGVMLWISTKA